MNTLVITSLDQLDKEIVKATIKAMQRSGKTAFTLSQKNVPVDSGKLKSRGRFSTTKDGYTITYKSDYAKDIEFGIPEDRPVVGNFTYKIPPHIRRGYRKKDGTIIPSVRIKGYELKLKDKKRVVMKAKNKYLSDQSGEQFSAEEIEGLQAPRRTQINPSIIRIVSVEKKRPGQYFLLRAVRDALKLLPKNLKASLTKEA